MNEIKFEVGSETKKEKLKFVFDEEGTCSIYITGKYNACFDLLANEVQHLANRLFASHPPPLTESVQWFPNTSDVVDGMHDAGEIKVLAKNEAGVSVLILPLVKNNKEISFIAQMPSGPKKIGDAK